jgi:hypothetical protein
MFRRSLNALGGKKKAPAVLGGRNILVPPKPAYPLQGGAVTPLGTPIRSRKSSAAEKRRKNLTKLALFIVVTFVLGMVPALRFLLLLNFAADVVLLAYLGLVVYMVVSPKPPRRERAPAYVEAPPARVAEGGF